MIIAASGTGTISAQGRAAVHELVGDSIDNLVFVSGNHRNNLARQFFGPQLRIADDIGRDVWHHAEARTLGYLLNHYNPGSFSKAGRPLSGAKSFDDVSDFLRGLNIRQASSLNTCDVCSALQKDFGITGITNSVASVGSIERWINFTQIQSAPWRFGSIFKDPDGDLAFDEFVPHVVKPFRALGKGERR